MGALFATFALTLERRMRDLNPREVALYTLSKRAHSATMRILRREGYPTASRLGPGEADRRALDICGLAQARRRLTASGRLVRGLVHRAVRGGVVRQ